MCPLGSYLQCRSTEHGRGQCSNHTDLVPIRYGSFVPGRPITLDISRVKPKVLAGGATGDCLYIFFSGLLFLFAFSLSLSLSLSL